MNSEERVQAVKNQLSQEFLEGKRGALVKIGKETGISYLNLYRIATGFIKFGNIVNIDTFLKLEDYFKKRRK